MKSLTSAGNRITQKNKLNQCWLFMGFISIILLIGLSASSMGIRQTLSLSKTNAPLITIFSEIRKQAGVDFLFKASWLKEAKPVTIHVKNTSLTETLLIVFKDQPFTYTLVDKTVILKPKEVIENTLSSGLNPIDIKGRVLNEKGDPVEGVTVTVKGTSKVAITDANGEFNMTTVDRDATLIFTSINMESFELKVSGKSELAIRLKTKVAALGDVTVTVNTGYQDIPKERSTGSFVKIDNKLFNQQAGTNVLKRLDGVSSGVYFNVGKQNTNPQNKTNISIRGLSTINGPLDPLIVLDGFIYEGDIENINPNDVDNVTILKDAAATSIWGARAGNGVIVITTKKGQFKQKTKVSVSANIILTEKPDLFNLPEMSSGDYIQVEELLFNNGYFDDQISFENYKGLSPAVEVFLKRKNGLISAEDSLLQINSLKQIDSRDQYNKYFYRNAATQQYSVSLSGGSLNNAYMLSLGYDNNLFDLGGKYKKINVRIDNILKLTTNLQFSAGIYYTNSTSNQGRTPYNSIQINGRNVPYLQFADQNGTPTPVASLYSNSYTDTAGEGKLLDWRYYPLEDYNHTSQTVRLQELFATTGLKYKLNKIIDIDLKYQYQKQSSDNEQLYGVESFYARNLINTFSQLDRSTGIVNYIVPLGSIRSIGNSTIESHTGRAQVNINHRWREHEIAGILGGELRQVKGISDNSTVYGYNSDPLTTSPVDMVNSYPNFITGNYEQIPGTPSSSNTVFRFASVYGNASYTLMNRYIVTASARRDGSNIFGANTNDKWKPLWSVGLGWKISDEYFYRSSILPLVKLRITYGSSGNVDLSKSALPIARYFTGTTPTNFPYARITTINNPELRWEQSTQTNFGVDFSLKNEIISGTIEYYLKKGVDLYGETPYDYTTWGGGSELTKNVANMTSKGVDVILHSKIFDKTFKWSASLLFNYNTSKTTKYYKQSAKNLSTLLGNGNVIIPIIGKPLYGIAAYKWGGLDASGNPQGFVNGSLSTDYQAIANEANIKGTDGNIRYIGPASPTTFGSFINTFSWKGIAITANISYKLGYYFTKNSIRYGSLISEGKGHKDYEKRWQNPGDELATHVPAFSFTNNSSRDDFYSLSEINVLKGDHIRLQYINLSYMLGNGNNKTSPFFDAQIYANISNIGILWRSNSEKIDPDYPNSIQPPRSFALGLKANF